MPHTQPDSFTITEDSTPYIIAEIGVNHEGSVSKAKELIDLAKSGGAHAAKFQTYKADTIASKHSPAYWDLKKEPTKSQHELFRKYDTFDEKKYKLLSDYCHKVGVEFLSTPFDDWAIDMLEPLVPFYKIASADLTNIPFLRKVARKNKPIILSTGASTLGEIDMALAEIKKNGSGKIGLLHCVLNYPTSYDQANLDMIIGLKRVYPELVIGYSDHTPPDPDMMVLTAAYLKGALVIEKHFTYDKSLPGNDHYHAMDVDDLKKFCKTVSFLKNLSGSSFKAPLISEEASRRYARRSIVLSKSIRSGQHLSEGDIICKRPGGGISPIYWDDVIGKQVRNDLPNDHILKWHDLKM